jgi:hypothetical protein
VVTKQFPASFHSVTEQSLVNSRSVCAPRQLSRHRRVTAQFRISLRPFSSVSGRPPRGNCSVPRLFVGFDCRSVDKHRNTSHHTQHPQKHESRTRRQRETKTVDRDTQTHTKHRHTQAQYGQTPSRSLQLHKFELLCHCRTSATLEFTSKNHSFVPENFFCARDQKGNFGAEYLFDGHTDSIMLELLAHKLKVLHCITSTITTFPDANLALLQLRIFVLHPFSVCLQNLELPP